MGLFDPNCPNVEMVFAAVRDIFATNVCVIHFPAEGASSITHYTSSESSDCVVIFLNHGHAYLLFPSESLDQRRLFFNCIAKQ
jgi:hypothetical protein